ncbi:YidB family protein [Gaiella sp.]|uniref:YidB family protein n=1 Tax=Gaiella sp. TaxID=2663207 RepID=UPI003267A271
MSQLDDLLGGLLGGKSGGVGGMLGGLAGSRGGGGGLVGALIPMIGGLLAGGGLSKLLSGFRANGLSSQADSWVGTGPNEPVTPGQVSQVIGADQIGQIAEKLGVSQDEAAQAIAEALPQIVDTVSPGGQLPPEQDLDRAFDRLAHPTPAQ